VADSTWSGNARRSGVVENKKSPHRVAGFDFKCEISNLKS
jgi:hypothetical protein